MSDYYYQNITRYLDHPRLAKIMDLVDPYSEILHVVVVIMIITYVYLR